MINYLQNTKIIARAHYAPSNLRDFSGLGFMDLGPNGMIELRYPEIPWTGEYNIFVRGDPKSHDQELEVTVIRENPLRHGSPCKKTGTQEEPRDIIRLKTASQYVRTSFPVASCKSIIYDLPIYI